MYGTADGFFALVAQIQTTITATQQENIDWDMTESDQGIFRSK